MLGTLGFMAAVFTLVFGVGGFMFIKVFSGIKKNGIGPEIVPGIAGVISDVEFTESKEVRYTVTFEYENVEYREKTGAYPSTARVKAVGEHVVLDCKMYANSVAINIHDEYYTPMAHR